MAAPLRARGEGAKGLKKLFKFFFYFPTDPDVFNF